jgi:hypothetical protein
VIYANEATTFLAIRSDLLTRLDNRRKQLEAQCESLPEVTAAHDAYSAAVREGEAFFRLLAGRRAGFDWSDQQVAFLCGHEGAPEGRPQTYALRRKLDSLNGTLEHHKCTLKQTAQTLCEHYSETLHEATAAACRADEQWLEIRQTLDKFQDDAGVPEINRV